MNCFTVNFSRKYLTFAILTLLLLLLAVYSFPLAAYAGSSSQTISMSSTHALALNSKGELFAWGDNYFGQLGIGVPTGTINFTPSKIGTATNWTAVSAGGRHSLALNSKGELFAWGSNTFGQLGLPTGSIVFPSPTQVGTGTNWVAISAGDGHSLALNSQGKLFAWGANYDGRLGDGSTINSSAPKQITTATNWTAISAGVCSSYAINSSGQLFAWGGNGAGQLGDGSTTNSMTPKQIGTAGNWVSVSAGVNHVLALNSEGQIFAWGNNSNGQLGTGLLYGSYTPVPSTTTSDWVAIAAGDHYSLAINSKGEVFAWGSDGSGQLGNATFAVSSPPKRVTTTPAASWVAVSAGDSTSLMLTSSGELFACGDNTYGQAGNGNVAISPAPLAPVLQFGAPGSAFARQRITFVTDTGAIDTVRTAQTGASLGTLPAPTREGHTFAGWWTAPTEGMQVSATTIVRSDMVLHARYTPLPPPPAPVFHTVTFDSAGGSSVAARTLSHGTAVGSLPVPTRKGFRFMGWFLPSGARLSESTLITVDTTVIARWASTNAKLKSIKPSTGKLNRKFAASRTAYTLPLSRSKSRVTISASPAHSKAKVEFRINKKWKKVNSQTVRLSRGSSQTVKVRVTAEDKQTVRTYTVKVTRAR